MFRIVFVSSLFKSQQSNLSYGIFVTSFLLYKSQFYQFVINHRRDGLQKPRHLYVVSFFQNHSLDRGRGKNGMRKTNPRHTLQKWLKNLVTKSFVL